MRAKAFRAESKRCFLLEANLLYSATILFNMSRRGVFWNAFGVAGDRLRAAALQLFAPVMALVSLQTHSPFLAFKELATRKSLAHCKTGVAQNLPRDKDEGTIKTLKMIEKDLSEWRRNGLGSHSAGSCSGAGEAT